MSGVRGWLARELSSVYAGYQEAAGKAAGVDVGETWQVAFRAAVASGELLHMLPCLLGDTSHTLNLHQQGLKRESRDTSIPVFACHCCRPMQHKGQNGVGCKILHILYRQYLCNHLMARASRRPFARCTSLAICDVTQCERPKSGYGACTPSESHSYRNLALTQGQTQTFTLTLTLLVSSLLPTPQRARLAGTGQLQLFDRPSAFTARRMSDGIWSAVAAPLFGSLALLAGTAVGAATNTLSGMLS
jgi:hypothetical protein